MLRENIFGGHDNLEQISNYGIKNPQYSNPYSMRTPSKPQRELSYREYQNGSDMSPYGNQPE